MGENSKIEWTDHTFNPWRLAGRHRVFLSSAFRHWDRLQVQSFMAILAERETVGYIVSKIRMIGERLDVVSLEVASPGITAMPTSKLVSRVYGFSPLLVLNGATVAFVSLVFAVAISVMRFTPCRSLSGDSGNYGSRLWGVQLAESVAGTVLCGLAHLSARRFAHLFPLHWRDKSESSFYPSLA